MDSKKNQNLTYIIFFSLFYLIPLVYSIQNPKNQIAMLIPLILYWITLLIILCLILRELNQMKDKFSKSSSAVFSIILTGIIIIVLFNSGISSGLGQSVFPPSGISHTAPPSSTPGATQTATTSAQATGSVVNGSDLFGGLSYNWVEYKMPVGSGSDAMTIYYKYDKQTGKCTLRFDSAQQVQGMPAEMDCSSSGTTTSDPNKVSSDAQVTCSPVDELVIVPAGTFTATKCTVTSKDGSATTWVVRDRFMVKMQSSSPQGSAEMILNAYG
jgi:hypothetical protein